MPCDVSLVHNNAALHLSASSSSPGVLQERTERDGLVAGLAEQHPFNISDVSTDANPGRAEEFPAVQEKNLSQGS